MGFSDLSSSVERFLSCKQDAQEYPTFAFETDDIAEIDSLIRFEVAGNRKIDAQTMWVTAEEIQKDAMDPFLTKEDRLRSLRMSDYCLFLAAWLEETGNVFDQHVTPQDALGVMKKDAKKA